MDMKQLKTKANSLIVQHKGKILAGATAAMTFAMEALPARADITTAATNGTAILQAGIAVARTEPLNWVIEVFAVGIGAIFFVKIVRRLV